MFEGIKSMFGMNNGAGAADNAPISPEVEATVTASAPEPVERGILRDCAAQLDAARQRVADGEAEVERLGLIIAEGDKVVAALQTSIASDGGAGLAAVVTGGKLDESMTSLVAIEMAARAATVRQPHAQAALEEARRVAMQIETDRNIAVRNLLLVEAGKIAAAHRRAWIELCVRNDELLAISAALPPLTRDDPGIHNSSVAFEVPSPNIGSSGSWSPNLRHIPGEYDFRIGPVTARWQAANAALLDDPDADFRALLDKPAVISAPGMNRAMKPATHVDEGRQAREIIAADFVSTANSGAF
jgi:hypothetical protein